ncbi:unnamed protein product [Brassica rapa subsp. narinosa]
MLIFYVRERKAVRFVDDGQSSFLWFRTILKLMSEPILKLMFLLIIRYACLFLLSSRVHSHTQD